MRLCDVVTNAGYKGIPDRGLVYHRQELLDIIVKRFQCGKVGLLGAGMGVVLVGLRGELFDLGRQLVNGDGFQRNAAQLPSGETSFPRKEDQVAPSLSASTTSSTNTMDVDIGRGWDTDLDDSRHPWIINTSSRDIAGH